jgi:hypothetical protein
VTVSSPTRAGGPPSTWAHRALYEGVRDALHALPNRFRSTIRIQGISATDLFTLNAPLGAAIEGSVVENLNSLREIWDPTDRYKLYSFVRQSQVFPDVRLETTAPGVSTTDRILMGIELKGWFILAKEGEPSFRYTASPQACAPSDLMVVFPWRLDEVISGAPLLMRPFIEEARYAAEHRNYYWQVGRGVSGPDAAIDSAIATAPYPSKGQKFNDQAQNDRGGNFGRVARGGLMTDFIANLLEERVSGIPAKYWQSFLKIFSEGAGATSIEKKLKVIKAEAEKAGVGAEGLEALDHALEAFRDLLNRS